MQSLIKRSLFMGTARPFEIVEAVDCFVNCAALLFTNDGEAL